MSRGYGTDLNILEIVPEGSRRGMEAREQAGRALRAEPLYAEEARERVGGRPSKDAKPPERFPEVSRHDMEAREQAGVKVNPPEIVPEGSEPGPKAREQAGRALDRARTLPPHAR